MQTEIHSFDKVLLNAADRFSFSVGTKASCASHVSDTMAAVCTEIQA